MNISSNALDVKAPINYNYQRTKRAGNLNSFGTRPAREFSYNNALSRQNRILIADNYRDFTKFFTYTYPQKVLDKYMTKEVVSKAVEENPNISQILETQNIKPIVEEKNIQESAQNHFLTTYDKAKELANIVNLNNDDKTILLEAALLHDIGKALIPVEIIDKPGRLTPKEREIIDLHADLGYEILKSQDIDPRVAQVVKLHHGGLTNDKKINTLAQILSTADVYSALKEKRSYKEAMSDETAKEIMSNDPKLNQLYVNAAFANLK